METKKLFEQVIGERNWYKPLGYTPQYASVLKRRLKNGTLGEEAIGNILEKLGYEKTTTWVKK